MQISNTPSTDMKSILMDFLSVALDAKKKRQPMDSQSATTSIAFVGDQQLSMEQLLKLMPQRKLTQEDFVKQTHLEYKMKADHEDSLGPEHVPIVNRDDMMGTIAASYRALSDLSEWGLEGQTLEVVIDKPQIFSTVDLKSLSPLNVASMMLRKTHKGNYLLCRTISPPVYDSGIALLLGVEDPEGNPAYVKLFNYSLLLDVASQEIDSVMPLGTILAIREPSYSANPATVDLPFVRVSSPSDVVFIDSDDAILRDVSWKGELEVSPLPTSGEDWKTEGLRHFKESNWLSAAISFTNCIKLEYDVHVSRLNRSEVYLRLGWNDSALCDAQEALDSGLASEELIRKAVVRKIKALYALKRYENVIETCKLLPKDKAVIEWSMKANKRIDEQKTGVFDWLALLKQDEKGAHSMDVADYTGPVEIKKDSNGSRGTYATRNIEAGELLMLHKALVKGPAGENPMEGLLDMFLVHVPSAKNLKDRDIYRLFCAVVQKVWDDEHAYKTILALFGGDHLEKPGPIPSPSTDSRPLEHPTKPKVDIDVDYLFGAVGCNSFGTRDIGKGGSLFGLPSLLNHSCIGNSNRTFYGDVIVIRAARDIKEGEELTLEYIEGFNQHDEKRFRLMNSWRFNCSCNLCKADEEDGYAARQERRRLLKKMEKIQNQSDELFHSHPVLVIKQIRILAAESKKICDRMRETYHKGHEEMTGGLKYELATALQYRANVLQQLAILTDLKTTFMEMIALKMESLVLRGLKVKDRTVSGGVPKKKGKMGALPINKTCISSNHGICLVTILEISHCFFQLGDMERSKRWFDAAVWISEIRFGGGMEAFKIRHKTELAVFNCLELTQAVHI